ncbi:MAG: hypothetical protein LBD89_05310 [Tannerellaceae bacterium]|nr:hypothetical protein [Tannerellaceae bacterium]
MLNFLRTAKVIKNACFFPKAGTFLNSVSTDPGKADARITRLEQAYIPLDPSLPGAPEEG